MSFAPAAPTAPAQSVTSAILEAVRSWRIARDTGNSIQPALYAPLETRGYGLLAPVLDGLLTLFEAASRRRFDAGAPSDSTITGDEHRLLDLLEGDDIIPPADQFRPDLVSAMRVAVRSARVMLHSMIRPEIMATA
ncbi:MAG: hypothetical protein V4610_10410 [Pseudomonadota bacterium]|jgi:hypothetical protein|uniref:Uncharacterized protein n=1 Tax=hydrothermal vent metagenome TaxID=652676 RepID=A0A160TLC2_9ZZZZ